MASSDDFMKLELKGTKSSETPHMVHLDRLLQFPSANCFVLHLSDNL